MSSSTEDETETRNKWSNSYMFSRLSRSIRGKYQDLDHFGYTLQRLQLKPPLGIRGSEMVAVCHVRQLKAPRARTGLNARLKAESGD